MSRVPAVLQTLALPALLDYVLTTQTDALSTTLIICSSREAFLEHLACSLDHERPVDSTRSLQKLLTPTLHNLYTTRHVKLAFCASVQTLLAYMTAYDRAEAAHGEILGQDRKQRLVLVNVLALHAPSSSFSAQGLSRTFALAAETALRVQAQLLLVECQDHFRHLGARIEGDVDITDELEQEPTGIEVSDPWEQEVSILNVSARRFGSSHGERAWAGRTIKIKRIAGRWFRFHALDAAK
ncbi:hypothetical protein ACN47E_009868 [Coniothyrium glycines]